MAGVKLQSADLAVTIFTSLFQIRGKLHVAGVLQTYMNDESKSTLPVADAEIVTFDANSPALHMSQPEFIIMKHDAEVILFDQPPAQGMISFLPRTEMIVAYTNRLAVRGKFYMGTDSTIGSFVGAIAGMFAVASDITVFPLVPVNGGIVGEAPVALISKAAFRALHKA
jgi:hypothetical protein